MTGNTHKQKWESYKECELRRALPLFEELGLTLEKDQVHVEGERYLMSGKKLVLTGLQTSSNQRVIIKVSSDKEGIREIERERLSRQTLQKLDFRGQTLLAPKELLYTKRKGVVIVVSEYIEQENPFLTRPLKEQFSLALRAFKMQESVHAATYKHAKVIRRVFGIWNVEDYLNAFTSFKRATLKYSSNNSNLPDLLEKANCLLEDRRIDIERYTGFLTHEDFALHNLRISGEDIYLIDHSSLRFGNKHESWARFINFMLLYSRELEQALVEYTRDNRSPEENLSLRLMRIYKIGQLLAYHSRAVLSSSNNLEKLSHARVLFWADVLDALLDNKPILEKTIEDYKQLRDSLRSNEEKGRQKILQQL